MLCGNLLQASQFSCFSVQNVTDHRGVTELVQNISGVGKSALQPCCASLAEEEVQSFFSGLPVWYI